MGVKLGKIFLLEMKAWATWGASKTNLHPKVQQFPPNKSDTLPAPISLLAENTSINQGNQGASIFSWKQFGEIIDHQTSIQMQKLDTPQPKCPNQWRWAISLARGILS